MDFMTGWMLVSYAVLLVYVCWQMLPRLYTCFHGPEDEDMVEMPPECGSADTDDDTWFVCRRCGRKTVYTRAQVRGMLETEERSC